MKSRFKHFIALTVLLAIGQISFGQEDLGTGWWWDAENNTMKPPFPDPNPSLFVSNEYGEIRDDGVFHLKDVGFRDCYFTFEMRINSGGLNELRADQPYVSFTKKGASPSSSLYSSNIYYLSAGENTVIVHVSACANEPTDFPFTITAGLIGGSSSKKFTVHFGKGACNKPRFYDCKTTPQSITVVFDQVPLARYYYITCTDENGNVNDYTMNQPYNSNPYIQYSITGLKPNTSYTVSVRAINDNMPSNAATLNARTPKEPKLTRSSGTWKYNSVVTMSLDNAPNAKIKWTCSSNLSICYTSSNRAYFSVCGTGIAWVEASFTCYGIAYNKRLTTSIPKSASYMANKPITGVYTDSTDVLLLSVDELNMESQESSFIVYPNPATTELNIKQTVSSGNLSLEEDGAIKTVDIFDVKGNKCASHVFNDAQTTATIDITDLANGIFVLVINKDSNDAQTCSFVKK